MQGMKLSLSWAELVQALKIGSLGLHFFRLFSFHYASTLIATITLFPLKNFFFSFSSAGPVRFCIFVFFVSDGLRRVN